MLEKPDIPDESILTCLQTEYRLAIAQIAFLPLGGDLSTAVYRAVAEDETPYFCKLKRGTFAEISVELPRFLHEQGMEQIIPPLLTLTGALWAELDEFRLILYPFIDGRSGFELELSQQHWADFGTALKRMHSMSLPPALSHKIAKESYGPEWRERCRDILRRLGEDAIDDPITQQLAAFLLSRREMIFDLIGRAERYAQILGSGSPEWVLCHSDIHPGNLFIDSQDTLFIVDWDYPMLAPKERDLMFVGGGQGFVGVTAQEEEQFFYRNYAPAAIDSLAMAYYRCERNIMDIAVECPRVLSPMLGDQDRARSLQILTWLFLPDGSVEIALKTGHFP